MSKERIPSFEELSFRLGSQLSAYLNRMTGNAATADDLLQETMLRIAKGLSTYEGRASIKNWAFRIATNVAIDHFRQNQGAYLQEFNDDYNEFDAPAVDEEDRLVVQEMNSCIREVIDHLSLDYRAALVLFHLQEKTVAEIAEILEISVSLAKVRIHRGKKLLKDALDSKCQFYIGPDGNVRCNRKD